MRCRDKLSCQSLYEGQLKQAGERLELLRSGVHRMRADLRPERERRLDELRGRLNRGAARLEALRRASPESWRTAAVHAEEAFQALSEALERLDQPAPAQPIAA